MKVVSRSRRLIWISLALLLFIFLLLPFFLFRPHTEIRVVSGEMLENEAIEEEIVEEVIEESLTDERIEIEEEEKEKKIIDEETMMNEEGSEEGVMRLEGDQNGEAVDNDPLLYGRTYHGEYNEFIKGRKYFIYNPTGGFNNQRVCFQNALEIARLTNRTLYVPMVGKHTSSWLSYESQTLETLFPFDRVIDFSYLSTYRNVTLVPLNVTLSTFIHRLSSTTPHVITQTDRSIEWGMEEVMKFMKPVTADVLYLRGSTMYHK